ncbi:MAG: ECF-type sigma factor [Planctomycetota bacterium]
MPTSITQYLEAVNQGEAGASDELLNVVYASLRQIAANRLGRDGATLHPTELVHEAWIRLGGNDAVDWKNRFHFFAAAAEAMRRTLIDNARQKQAAKRGGRSAKRVTLSGHEPTELPLADELLDLDDALTAFEKVDPLKAQVVKLKYFAGMTIAEIAEMTNLSAASVERYWAYAKAWLFEFMSDED